MDTYNEEKFGDVKLMEKFRLQRDDAKRYFESCIKPRLDRSYKLYTSYSGDRASELKRLGKTWMANIFVPYVNAVVETLMPRILDARPEFSAMARTEEDQVKTEALQKLTDYTWEKSKMDTVSEDITRSALVFGTGFLQVGWKKDVREYKFLDTKDLSKKKYKYTKKEQVYYDAPFAEAVDNYTLWYDWHNVARESKQYWFKRLVLTGAEIKRKYPKADKKRLELALKHGASNLINYASIRDEVKLTHEGISKNGNSGMGASGISSSSTSIGDSVNGKYISTEDPDLIMHEVFEWWRPFDDEYAVVVNEVPIFRERSIPNPYDFKEAPFIEIPYLRLPYEFEGTGIPMVLESPQIMLNTMKNQRLDAVTLSIHRMWVVNPLANINKNELVTRPFGIIYSADPNGVREIQFSDIKSSAYKEEEFLKNDMRYASGVDDFSMAAGGGASSATEVRHLRESTLERVRLFVNHLGEGYSTMMRYWISLWRQFYTEQLRIRITGEDGEVEFPVIEKDDLMGEFDFKAAVIPSIAGKNDIEKKQGMDLFQLLINMPFVDPQKLTSKILHNWNWSLESVKKEEQPQMPGQPGQPGEEGMLPGMEGGQMPPEGPMPPGDTGSELDGMPRLGGGEIPSDVIQQALAMLGNEGGENPFAELGSPVNLLESGGKIPPTVAPMKGGNANPRGLNRGGKVNTNISSKPSSPDDNITNLAMNLQS